MKAKGVAAYRRRNPGSNDLKLLSLVKLKKDRRMQREERVTVQEVLVK